MLCVSLLFSSDALGDGTGVSLIPAPSAMSFTGGECRTKTPVKKERLPLIPPEGYELSIAADGVTVRFSDDAGAFYADMTLRQLRRERDGVSTYPCVEIKDSPAFKWRGVHFDDCRHFFGKEVVKRTIDLVSQYKYNVFHWHLTDNQAWLIDIPGYPKLIRQGQGRKMGEAVGPFHYTANDIREIVEYAKTRYVTIVPEVEFPGHFAAAGRAYPDFICPTAKKQRKSICVGNADAVRFAEKALDYICELFPSEVIHIGGDECSRVNWKTCPRCKAFMARESLKSAEEIQPWLTRHLAEYLAGKGRCAIGWEEIFADGVSALPAGTIGMSWNGDGGIAANSGHEVVCCSTKYCYFDFSQELPKSVDPFPYFIKGRSLPFERVYQFDPLEGVDRAARGKVLGGECCNWTERTPNAAVLEWKMWPRALAMAEVLWTYPDPAKRDFVEFSVRANEHRLRLMANGINCAPLGAASAGKARATFSPTKGQ